MIHDRQIALEIAQQTADENGAPVWIEYDLRWGAYLIHETPANIPARPWTYRLYLHGDLIDETPLVGIASLKFESAKMLGLAELHEVYIGADFDPVLHTTIIHRGGIKPPCNPQPAKCQYRQSLERSFYATSRPTALRVEVVCPTDRCGYMIRPSRIGGNFWDYAACFK